jgi:hypothetical protein
MPPPPGARAVLHSFPRCVFLVYLLLHGFWLLASGFWPLSQLNGGQEGGGGRRAGGRVEGGALWLLWLL